MTSLRDHVKAAVDELDPEGLLAMGAPRDEYDPEIADFVAQIARGEPMTAESVTSTWERWFEGCSGAKSPDVMSRLADALAEAARTAARQA